MLLVLAEEAPLKEKAGTFAIHVCIRGSTAGSVFGYCGCGAKAQ